MLSRHALASGEADASFANVGFIFFWPSFDDVGNLSLLSGLLDSCVIDFIWSNSKGYVFFDGAVGEKDGLRDVGNMGLPCTIIDCVDGFCIYFKCTFGWRKQSHDDIEQSAFTAAGDADEAYSTAFFYVKVKVFDDKWRLWGVTK